MAMRDREELRGLADAVRLRPLEEIAPLLGFVRDPADRSRWRREGSVLSVTGIRFFDHLQGRGGGGAIGSGVVEAANKILVTQRMKRSGMRWRIQGGQAVLTVCALIKSGRFDRAWAGHMGDADTPANDNNRASYATRRAA